MFIQIWEALVCIIKFVLQMMKSYYELYQAASVLTPEGIFCLVTGIPGVLLTIVKWGIKAIK